MPATVSSAFLALAPWLAAAFILAMLWIFWAADRSALPGLITLLYAFPFGDKVGHFVLVGLLALAVNVLLSRRWVRLGAWSVLLGSVLVALGITLEEFSQTFFSARTFSLVDLAFSYLGIIAADVALRQVRK